MKAETENCSGQADIPGISKRIKDHTLSATAYKPLGLSYFSISCATGSP